MPNYYLGLDLGGTNIKAGIVDEAGELRGRTELATQIDGDLSPEAVIARIMVAAKRACDEAKVKKLGGAGVVSPGKASLEEGIVHRAANFPTWKDVPLREKLARALKLRVVLENDANAAAYGEYWAGFGKRKPETLLAITLGTGVGGGLIHHGKLVRGMTELAGEIGHMIVDPNGNGCNCGQRGCLETYCSAPATARRAMAALRKAPTRSSLVPLLEARGRLTAADVSAHAKAGDAVALEQWDITCRYVALGCLNALRLFDPDVLVLCGGMTNAKDQLLLPVTEHLQKMWWSIAPLQAKISLSRLGRDAGMIGAAGLAKAATQTKQ